MNKKIKTIISAITIVISLMSYTSVVFAQDNTETKDSRCIEEMKPYINEKSAEFRKYLTEHFQSKNTNTSLLDLALKRFEVYKKDLRTKYQSYGPQEGLKLVAETRETLGCYKQMNEEIILMENLLVSYYKQTSNIKTSTAFMTKLQQINKNLDQLALEITQMLGKWKSLKDRIPCFVKKCL